MKKAVLLSLLCTALLGLAAFQDDPEVTSDSTEQEIIDSYEQYPPTALEFSIRKLAEPLNDGSNLIMRIKYANDVPLLPVMKIYTNNTAFTLFHDDGTGCDSVAGDGIYAAYVTEDIPGLVAQLENMEAALQQKGSFTVFNGHLAHTSTGLPTFNSDQFYAGGPVPLSPDLLNARDCGTALLKQNSLLITDLSVVEDPARTYNIVRTTNKGNPDGVWTFGNLVKNIAGPGTNRTRDFLKEWIKQWTTAQTINGQVVPARADVFRHLISPWIRKAHDDEAYAVTEANWEAEWDATPEIDLVRNAPFKLTAIVNRIDVRGNGSFKPLLKNAGETRFIYSLIAPYAVPSVNVAAGGVPRRDNQDFFAGASTRPDGFMDWEGMNVIFEYFNQPPTNCDTRDLTQRWYDLSAYPGYGPDYNAALEAITHEVIDRTTIKGGLPCALARIRTNEKIFFRMTANGNIGWKPADWEMRQFELDRYTGNLVGTPVFNTPRRDLNFAKNIPAYAASSDPAATLPFMNWVFGAVVATRLAAGTHVIPATYLAAVATSDAEYVQYFDFNYYEDSLDYTGNAYKPNDVNRKYGVGKPATPRELRVKLSLNTCQGCHAGETKGQFTHIRPLGYGETAKYWETIPDVVQRHLDTRVMVPYGNSSEEKNVGKTFVGTPPVAVPNYAADDQKRYYMKVSAFLTGRNYSGLVSNGAGTFQDDDNGATDNQRDPYMDGKFVVYDPSNDANNSFPNAYTPEPYNLVNGYNDLERRKNDLCRFINAECSQRVLTILATASRRPLPSAAH
jgi:hypothetical protein